MIVDYIKTIASFLIFYAFVELLLPSSSFKKYIRVVLGLMTLVIILKPLISVMAQNPQEVINSMFTIEQSLDAATWENEQKSYDQITQQTILMEYKYNLGEKIEIMVKSCGMILTAHTITVNEDSTDVHYGQILEMELIVSEKLENKIKIDPIQISPSDDTTEQEQGKAEEIKKLISDFYNLSQDNIHIIFRR